MSDESVIHVVGGVYEERCTQPQWHEVFGSAGRAASAIAGISDAVQVELHCCVDSKMREAVASRCALEGVTLSAITVERTCRFKYTHGLETPHIEHHTGPHAPIQVSAAQVVRFGMLDGEAVVHAQRVVYDPQSASSPATFQANGSRAEELAVVLNQREAAVLTGIQPRDDEALAHAVYTVNTAQVVVLKRGPLGALVYDGSHAVAIPAYASQSVWKIGSGDVFVGHFAYRWLHERRSAVESARLASQATALYCESSGFPRASAFASFSKSPIIASKRFMEGYRPTVYLAGPFFTLAQLWLIEQARGNLQSFDLNVFSPYHDVGHGSADDVVERDLQAIQRCDVVFAVGDGLDSGTIYEIGYARSRDIPVIMYCENESSENTKMMQGSGCVMCTDYVTAIYKTLWIAAAL